MTPAPASKGLEQDVSAVADALSRRVWRAVDEAQLQSAIAEAFILDGIGFSREHLLSRTDRPDFLVWGRVAVEVKVAGTLAEVTRQLLRYAGSPKVAAVVLVTTDSRHVPNVDTLSGKPFRSVLLRNAWTV